MKDFSESFRIVSSKLIHVHKSNDHQTHKMAENAQ